MAKISHLVFYTNNQLIYNRFNPISEQLISAVRQEFERLHGYSIKKIIAHPTKKKGKGQTIRNT
jgi:hypothetical protein